LCTNDGGINDKGKARWRKAHTSHGWWPDRRGGGRRIGISARSLFSWQKQHPEFLQAIQEGRQRSQLWWEERAMASGEAGSTQIVMLGLRNRTCSAGTSF
jgi:hypothetical protein